MSEFGRLIVQAFVDFYGPFCSTVLSSLATYIVPCLYVFGAVILVDIGVRIFQSVSIGGKTYGNAAGDGIGEVSFFDIESFDVWIPDTEPWDGWAPDAGPWDGWAPDAGPWDGTMVDDVLYDDGHYRD